MTKIAAIERMVAARPNAIATMTSTDTTILRLALKESGADIQTHF